jgi:DNA-binding transcriptional MerR regulator
MTKSADKAKSGQVIHVEFGPGGGRRVAQVPPPPDEPKAAPAAEAVSLAEAHRRDPVGDLYARAEVARLFDLPESRLRYWDRTGFLAPSGRVGARRFYTFQDLIGLRAAKGLLEKGVPLRRVRKSVEALKGALPNVVRPLSELRVVADGKTCVVEGPDRRWDPATGQLVLDFDVRTLRDEVVRMLRPSSVDPVRRRMAYDAYLEGCRLDEDPSTYAAAEAAYHKAIELDASFAHAHTNLGNLRFRRGDAKLAEAAYQQALALDPDQPEALYNLGFLAFERGETAGATQLFARAVNVDPGFADAHFNLAMALEELGRGREAKTHWESYLSLEPVGPWADIAKKHL